VTTDFRCPGDVVALPAGSDRWVVMNVFARTCLGLDGDGLGLMRQIPAGRHGDSTARVWEIERFSNLDGLLADPSRFVREAADWPEPETVDETELADRLERHCLIIADEEAYRARFAPKRNLLDRQHFGNFHEQMGQHLMLTERTLPDDWWLSQKFDADIAGFRNNLYGAVQGFALPPYFEQRLGPGNQVVDIGCGPGFFTNMMATTGATLLGVDPNEKYVEMARRRAHENARFEIMNIGYEGGCDGIADDSADIVFMSDALLFYFVPNDVEVAPDMEILFRDIRRILKPDGRLISLEPHHVFWLNPWLGDADRPFTIINGYRDSSFRVTGTLSELIQAFAAGGFAVTWMDELRPDPAFESVDRRAYHFAEQFPLWHLFELAAMPEAPGS